MKSPMLATEYNCRKHNLTYPLFIQPKLDGVRALYYEDNLWSRNHNMFSNFDSLKLECRQLSSLLKEENLLFLDGELYSQSLSFQDIVSVVKTKYKWDLLKREKAEKIKYYIFDFCNKSLTFEKRYQLLEDIFNKHKFEHLILVETKKVNSYQETEIFYNQFISQNYEGMMFRNNTVYDNKRTKNLQKLKPSDSDEFEIISFKQGIEKEKGCIVWELKTKEGVPFTARPIGDYETRKKYFKTGNDYIGKMATIKYQGFSEEGVPRFPVFIEFRNYE